MNVIGLPNRQYCVREFGAHTEVIVRQITAAGKVQSRQFFCTEEWTPIKLHRWTTRWFHRPTRDLVMNKGDPVTVRSAPFFAAEDTASSNRYYWNRHIALLDSHPDTAALPPLPGCERPVRYRVEGSVITLYHCDPVSALYHATRGKEPNAVRTTVTEINSPEMQRLTKGLLYQAVGPSLVPLHAHTNTLGTARVSQFGEVAIVDFTALGVQQRIALERGADGLYQFRNTKFSFDAAQKLVLHSALL